MADNILKIEGMLVNHDSQALGEAQIDRATGLILHVGELSGDADIRAGDNLVFPGFVDLHVHAREDVGGTQSYKEDFKTVSEAAIRGGVVHIADMPNNPTAPVTDDTYRQKKLLSERSLVDVTLYAGIGPETHPLSSTVPYKVFMGPSVGDLFFTSKEQLEKTLERYRGRAVSFHCEDPETLEQHKAQPTHISRRPSKAEIDATGFAIELIERYHLKGKLCHLSTREALQKVVEAKARGVDVTSEVAPHHLYFDESMLTKENELWLQMNPPLRKKEDRMGLLGALKRGDIDYLATDHAPHTVQEKLKGVSGVPHLDTYGLIACWLMNGQGFQPQDIARVCSYNPGAFVNQFLPAGSLGKGFGKIEEGYVGSLTVLDLGAKTKVVREELKTKCGWSPFEGVEFPGKARYTIVKGRVYEL